jgi:hypothetical protein
MVKIGIQEISSGSANPPVWVILVMATIGLALSLSSHVIEVTAPVDTVPLQIVAWVSKVLGLFGVTMSGVMVSTRIVPQSQQRYRDYLRSEDVFESFADYLKSGVAT